MVPQQQRRRRRRVALPRTAERRVVIGRGAGGFGFTIAGQRPCVVSAVAPGGPAERAGLRAGDALLAVDGASVARAPHASVARLVAAAPGAIALSVAPRECPPTDTEDTEPDERVRTRRRHPPPRRRPHLHPHSPLHHPACHAVPSTSGVNEILQNLSRVQLTSHHAARLECRAVVGYLGTIETPQAASSSAPNSVRSAVRKLRQERRPATPVLLSVLPNVLLLRRATNQVLAQYHRDRIQYAGCGSDADLRFFGLVTSPDPPTADTSLSCHIFGVDPRAQHHAAHSARAAEFGIACTRDPVAERCLEFPPSAEYVVGVIRGMYSLPADDCTSPALQQISKLAVKGDSPGVGNFARVFRPRRAARHDDPAPAPHSPQPSITTTSSNSDSGIGFHNDCRNIADRILVVDFAGHQPTNRFRQDAPRRPVGLVGCSFDAETSFLSNTTPVVDGFGGQGRPLNLDDVMLSAGDLQPVRHADDHYNDGLHTSFCHQAAPLWTEVNFATPGEQNTGPHYSNIYGNYPSSSHTYHDQVYESEEQHQSEHTETFNSVEMYERTECQSYESVESATVVSGASRTSRASADSVSVCSSRSVEEREREGGRLQASLDDLLLLGMRDRDPPPTTDHQVDKHDGTFLHPATVKCKVRKSSKPLNILSRTKHMLTGRDKKEERRRAISASAGDVTGAGAGADAGAGAEGGGALPAANSEPDLRDTQGARCSIPFQNDALEAWSIMCPDVQPPEKLESQREWDDLSSKFILSDLTESAVGVDKARIMAGTCPESGAWLHALPSPQLGTHLEDNSLRVAVALRLGCKVCETHRCPCGVSVDESGHHGLSCSRCAGRFPRHHALNKIIRRALVSAKIPCVLEPPGQCRTDGKRPDGITLVPWEKGRSLVWDATCVSSFATSHVPLTMRKAGSAAEHAARQKRIKYAELERQHLFIPFAVETAGPWCEEAKKLVRELGRRLRDSGCDPRSGSYLVQHISLAIQRGNAAGVMGTFEPGTLRGGLFD